MSVYIDNKYVRLISFRLRNFKQKKENLYNFSCPFCGDSKRNVRKARGFVYRKDDALFYKCYNCSVSTTVGNLVDHIDPSLYKEYVLERFIDNKPNNTYAKKPVYSIPATRFDRVENIKVFDNAEWCYNLPSSHRANQYINLRKIPLEYRKTFLYTSDYRKFVDTTFPGHGLSIRSEERLIIPFFDKYNDLIAVVGRFLGDSDGAIKYIMVAKEGVDVLYGADRLNYLKDIKVVEGPLDSMFIMNSVASSNADLRRVSNFYDSSKLVLIYDNEPRNKQIVRQIEKSIDLGFRVVIWPDIIQEKDINDMIISGKTAMAIESIIYNNTFSGITAKFRFNLWKRV